MIVLQLTKIIIIIYNETFDIKFYYWTFLNIKQK